MKSGSVNHICLIVAVIVMSFMLLTISAPDASADEVQYIGELKKATKIMQKANAKSKLIRKARIGEKGMILGQSRNGKWMKIRFESGEEGWVGVKLLAISEKKPEPEEPEKIPEPVIEEPKGPPPSLMALNIEGGELNDEDAALVNDAVLLALSQRDDISLISQKDVVDYLIQGGKENPAECVSSTECVMDIGSALNGDMLLGGKVGRVGEVWTINLYIMDAKKSETLSRISKESASEENLTADAAEAVEMLFKDLNENSQAITVSMADLGKNPQIAVMDFVTIGVDETLGETLTDVVTVELKQFKGVKVISRREIATMLSFEGYKQQMGSCTEESCLAEIGAALGVGYLINGSINKIEDTYILVIRVLNNRKAKVIGREQEYFMGPADGLLPAARFALRKIFGAPYQGDGLLKVSVNERRTQVSLNGKNIGLTPDLTMPDPLPSGKYRLEASKDDYYPQARDVYVEPARQTQVQLVLEEAPTPWYKTWWFWTITGVVVAGGVTTGVVLGTMDAGDAPPASGQAIIPAN